MSQNLNPLPVGETNRNTKQTAFDAVVLKRLQAKDFAQPKVKPSFFLFIMITILAIVGSVTHD